MAITSSEGKIEGVHIPRDIDWKMLDKSKFFLLGSALFSGISATLYPIVVLKTRQQIVESQCSCVKMAVSLIQKEGIRSLYRGFATSLTGTIPARALYMAALEVTKSNVGTLTVNLGFPESTASTIANATAGLSAAMAAQLVWTPIDVVTQRLMVHGSNPINDTMNDTNNTKNDTNNTNNTKSMKNDMKNDTKNMKNDTKNMKNDTKSTKNNMNNMKNDMNNTKNDMNNMKNMKNDMKNMKNDMNNMKSDMKNMKSDMKNSTKYEGGMEEFRKIVRKDGIRGLYRGFGLSILTYAPSNAVWWGSYSISQRILWRLLKNEEEIVRPSSGVVTAVQGVSAAVAGGVSAVVTMPLDTIKTRVQVLEMEKKKSIGYAVRVMVREGGWLACYRGLGPRWASMVVSATTMITTYEFLKRLSAKD